MLRTFVKNNAGLLLIVASEVFYAFMHASVKVLMTEGQPAIPVLEVLCYDEFITRPDRTIVARSYCSEW